MIESKTSGGAGAKAGAMLRMAWARFLRRTAGEPRENARYFDHWELWPLDDLPKPLTSWGTRFADLLVDKLRNPLVSNIRIVSTGTALRVTWCTERGVYFRPRRMLAAPKGDRS